MEKQPLRRIDLNNRTPLETVIPLSTPFVINVDPSDNCNFQCKFCPTGDRQLMKDIGRPMKVMDFELFKKIVDDIQTFDKPLKVLRLYKDGEPLLNPKFAEMVKYAKASGNIERVDTTSNGSLLTPEKSLAIVEAGLDKINISIEGVTEKQYKDFSNARINLPKLIENIKFLYENRKQLEVVVKINGDTISEDDKKIFMETFSPISNSAYIEHVMSCWPEFDLANYGLQANSEFGIYGQQIKEVSACSYVFYSFSINSDGTCSTCFLDWSRKLLIGDVRQESVKNVWLGKKMQAYQKMFLRGERKKHPVCKDCGQMSHGMPDNIDPYAKELLGRLNETPSLTL
jgi:radical SAM protein with 4Fe4S-binding SPASM domain